MTSLSEQIAQEFQRLFPGETKIIKVKMLHEADVRKFIMGIEKAHKRASKSKLIFKAYY